MKLPEPIVDAVDLDARRPSAARLIGDEARHDRDRSRCRRTTPANAGSVLDLVGQRLAEEPGRHDRSGPRDRAAAAPGREGCRGRNRRRAARRPAPPPRSRRRRQPRGWSASSGGGRPRPDGAAVIGGAAWCPPDRNESGTARRARAVGDDDQDGVLLPLQLEQQRGDVFGGGADPGCRSARRTGAACGCRTSARAIATRCRSPPESAAGPVIDAVGQADALDERLARASTSSRCGATSVGTSTFSSTVHCGSRQ